MTSKILFVCYLFPAILAFAQTPISDKDYELQYKKAVQLYATQAYEESRTVLFPLTHRRNTNTYVPFTLYYHALCSIKLNKYFEARLMLRQLFERYPDWKKNNEAYYIFANACLADTYFDEAVMYLQKIDDPAMKEDKNNLLYHYALVGQEVEPLKKLQRQYPNEAGIALALVEKIQSKPNASKSDLALSDNLTNRFNLGKKINSSPKPNKNIGDNGIIQVAFLLPFKVQERDYKNKTNQYIYDLYEGAKWARTKLQTEGINLQLSAFDIEKSAEKMLDVVNTTEFEQMDLLVGPLYPESNKIATMFAEQKGAILLNPLSNNSQLVTGQSTIYLVQTSYEYQAQKMSELMSTLNKQSSAAIYYGSSKKDSTFAAIYKNNLEAQGRRVLEFKRISGNEPILQGLNPSHVFVSASENTFAAKVLNQLEKRKLNTPLIGTSGAFDLENMSSSSFNNKNIYIVYPEFVDRNKREVQIFAEQYFQKRNTIASYYTMLGYDLLLFYGRVLAKGGLTNFRSGLNSYPACNECLLSGFDYSGDYFENKNIPIVRFRGGEFELVN